MPREGVCPQQDLQTASGMISSTQQNQGFVALGFQIHTSHIEETSAYTSLQFALIPGYEAEEYPDKEPESWDKFRDYFRNNFPWTD